MRFEKSLYENRFSGGLSGLSIFSRVFSAGGALRSEKTVQRFFKSLKPPEKRFYGVQIVKRFFKSLKPLKKRFYGVRIVKRPRLKTPG